MTQLLVIRMRIALILLLLTGFSINNQFVYAGGGASRSSSTVPAILPASHVNDDALEDIAMDDYFEIVDAVNRIVTKIEEDAEEGECYTYEEAFEAIMRERALRKFEAEAKRKRQVGEFNQLIKDEQAHYEGLLAKANESACLYGQYWLHGAWIANGVTVSLEVVREDWQEALIRLIEIFGNKENVRWFLTEYKKDYAKSLANTDIDKIFFCSKQAYDGRGNPIFTEFVNTLSFSDYLQDEFDESNSRFVSRFCSPNSVTMVDQDFDITQDDIDEFLSTATCPMIKELTKK